MNCARKDCPNEATKTPRLLLWAARDAIMKHRNKAATIEMDRLPHCNECAEKTTAKDLISDEGWEVIKRVFKNAGRAEPRRWSAKLEWKEIPQEVADEPLDK